MSKKYLSTGQEVNLIEKLSNGKFLVELIIEYYDAYDDAQEAVGEYRIVDHVFDKAPVEIIDKTISIKKAEIHNLQTKISELKAQIKEQEERFRKNSNLLNESFKKFSFLESFLNIANGGKYFYLDGDSDIVEMTFSKDLFININGDLFCKKEHRTVYDNQDKVKHKLFTLIVPILDSLMGCRVFNYNDSYKAKRYISLAQKHNLILPEKYLSYPETLSQRYKNQEIARLESELNKLKGEA